MTASLAGWIARAATPGRLPLNSSIRCSSQSGVAGGPVSRLLSDVVPQVLMAGLRTLTVNVRVSYLPAEVSTFSIINRRDSALIVVEVALAGSPKRIVTS